MYLTIPTLNTRETALVVWAVIGLMLACRQASVRQSMVQLLRTLLQSKILSAILVAAAAYEVVGIFLVWHLGYWHASMFKIAVVWYFGSAIAALGDFKGSTSKYLRNVVLSGLAFAALVGFIENLYTFPTIVELILVPIVFLLVGTQAVSAFHPEYSQVRSVLSCTLGLFGLTLIGFAIVKTVQSASQVITVETAEGLLFPVFLALWFLPFLYLNRLFSIMQQNLLWVKFRMTAAPDAYHYARRSILLHCGLSTARAAFFGAGFPGRFWDVTDASGVDSVMREFEDEWRSRGED